MAMKVHDHNLCLKHKAEDGVEISSLPSSDCGWEGHDEAVTWEGWCPVCQH